MKINKIYILLILIILTFSVIVEANTTQSEDDLFAKNYLTRQLNQDLTQLSIDYYTLLINKQITITKNEEFIEKTKKLFSKTQNLQSSTQKFINELEKLSKENNQYTKIRQSTINVRSAQYQILTAILDLQQLIDNSTVLSDLEASLFYKIISIQSNIATLYLENAN